MKSCPPKQEFPTAKNEKKISLIQGARFHIFTCELDEAVLIFLDRCPRNVQEMSKKKRDKLRSVPHSSSSVSIILILFSVVSKSPKKIRDLRFQVGWKCDYEILKSLIFLDFLDTTKETFIDIESIGNGSNFNESLGHFFLDISWTLLGHLSKNWFFSLICGGCIRGILSPCAV